MDAGWVIYGILLIIGMFERTVIYPIMIGHALLGSSVAAAQRRHATRPLTPLDAQAAS
jgi:hypothetical protein